jgi:Cof subfamily protein (haloacid dehalogenase superfamily)
MPDPQPLPDWRSNPAALEPFSRVALVAVDLDGTLVGADGAVVDQIQTLQHGLLISRGGHQGVKLTFATGRSLTWVLKLQQELVRGVPKGTPLVLYNGSVVIEAVTGIVLFREELSADTLAAIVATTRGKDVDVYAYAGPSEWSIGEARPERVVAWSNRMDLPQVDVNGAPIEWNGAEGDLGSAVAVLIATRESAAAQRRLLVSLSEVVGISVTSSGGGYIEVRPQGSSKARGLEAAVAQLNIDRRRVLALGDSDNDIEMLEWAGLSVVVAGATPGAQAHSDFVTRRGASSGVIEVLRAIKHARRYFPPSPRRSPDAEHKLA